MKVIFVTMKGKGLSGFNVFYYKKDNSIYECDLRGEYRIRKKLTKKILSYKDCKIINTRSLKNPHPILDYIDYKQELDENKIKSLFLGVITKSYEI